MSWIETSVAFADQRVHGHRRDHVFSDGVVLGDALDAIAAAGLVGNYGLANQLCVQYALDVCVRCAKRYIEVGPDEEGNATRTPLSEIGILTSWGSVCRLCKLALLAYGVTQRFR